MPTIATVVDQEGNRKVLTKVIGEERRVSCSCCEGAGCCMYPADQLGVGYTEDDLPDEVIVQFPDEPPSTWSRSGSYFVLGNLSLRPVGARWALFRDEDEEGDRGVQCLIEPDLLAPRVTDNFADTYTVEFLTNKEVTVTRQSLCSWFGTATIDGFEYEASLGYNDQTFQWEAGFSTVDISSGFNPKDGNQNTPVGTYSGDNVITVSE